MFHPSTGQMTSAPSLIRDVARDSAIQFMTRSGFERSTFSVNVRPVGLSVNAAPAAAVAVSIRLRRSGRFFLPITQSFSSCVSKTFSTESGIQPLASIEDSTCM
jgi:hypothetical protein